MNLRKKTETTDTITLEWDPVPGAVGYRFQSASQPKWSHTFDPARTSVKFSKAASYKVEALGVKDAGSYPSAEPPPTGSKLLWAPPSLSNPITINLANDGSNREINLNGRDAIINIDAYDCGQRGGFNLNSPGNVHIIGGKVYGTRYAHYLAMNIQDPLGVVHIEGVDFAGPWIMDCMALRTTSGYSSPSSAIIQIQNCRGVATIPPGQSNAIHPDFFQWQGDGANHHFTGLVRMNKVTFSTCMTGINAGTIGVRTPLCRLLLKEVNAHFNTGADGTVLTAYLVQWHRSGFVYEAGSEMWGEVGNSPTDPRVGGLHNIISNCVQPSGLQGRVGIATPLGADKARRSQDAQGFYCDWPVGSNMLGIVREGNPPGGDFCPAGVPGVNYVSPGYA